MTTILSRLTQTDSLAVNVAVAVALTFIGVCLLAVVSHMIINPQDVVNASFGIID